MRKKICAAIVVMCTICGAAGCGQGVENKQDVQVSSDDNLGSEEALEADGPVGFGTRLVSVDNVDKYVKIGNYKGLTLDNTVEEISEAQINERIEQDLKNSAEEVTGKKGKVRAGDIVTINYVGTKDGKTFEGGTANNYDLTVGEGTMLEGFEDGLIGMKKGETKDLNLTYPQEYSVADLAGQDVVFQVTLQKFRRAAELSDGWVAKNTHYTTVEDYRAQIKAELEEAARNNAQETLKDSAWHTVLAQSEVVEYPQEDMDNAIAEFKQLNERYASQGDMTLEEFVESQGISMEDFEEQCRQYAEFKVKQNLIVQGIMDKEGIRLDDDECVAIENQLVEEYEVQDTEALVSQYGQAGVNESIGLLRVTAFILDNAIVQDSGTDGSMQDAGSEGDPAGEQEE